MDQNKLRQIIEQVLTEMELNGNTAVDTAPAACEPAPAANVTGDESKAQATPVIEPDSILDDVPISIFASSILSRILRTRIATWSEGSFTSPSRHLARGGRYKTNTCLRFRADTRRHKMPSLPTFRKNLFKR